MSMSHALALALPSYLLYFSSDLPCVRILFPLPSYCQSLSVCALLYGLCLRREAKCSLGLQASSTFRFVPVFPLSLCLSLSRSPSHIPLHRFRCLPTVCPDRLLTLLSSFHWEILGTVYCYRFRSMLFFLIPGDAVLPFRVSGSLYCRPCVLLACLIIVPIFLAFTTY